MTLWKAVGWISREVLGALITAALAASLPLVARALPQFQPYADWTVALATPMWALASTGLGVLGLCGTSYFAATRARGASSPTGVRVARPTRKLGAALDADLGKRAGAAEGD